MGNLFAWSSNANAVAPNTIGDTKPLSFPHIVDLNGLKGGDKRLDPRNKRVESDVRLTLHAEWLYCRLYRPFDS